jgi:hypothetical protein
MSDNISHYESLHERGISSDTRLWRYMSDHVLPCWRSHTHQRADSAAVTADRDAVRRLPAVVAVPPALVLAALRRDAAQVEVVLAGADALPLAIVAAERVRLANSQSLGLSSLRSHTGKSRDVVNSSWSRSSGPGQRDPSGG